MNRYLLLVGIVVCCETSSAADENKYFPPTHDYGFDYAAVCDFVSSRIGDSVAEMDASESVKASRMATGSGGATFHWKTQGLSVEYGQLAGQAAKSSRVITKVIIDGSRIFETDQQKNHLLMRLGFKAEGIEGKATAFCDNIHLDLFFKANYLLRVEISQSTAVD